MFTEETVVVALRTSLVSESALNGSKPYPIPYPEPNIANVIYRNLLKLMVPKGRIELPTY